MSCDGTGVWPPSQLERLGDCPVCGSMARHVLHPALIDKSFGVAPGDWTLYRCENCQAAYLDPRPDRGSIGRAYDRYYTHDGEAAPPRSGLLGRLKRMLADDYRRWRYGYNGGSTIWGGRWIGRIAPSIAANADRALRYLPRPNQSQRLLDIGSGSGEFLQLALRCGWQACGVEPDGKATAVRAHAFEVRPALDDWGAHEQMFDAITLNHSIEHLHDPAKSIETVAKLLRPGGFLFIETPNIDSVGHRLYGENWRGLEAPRHLVIFTRRSLANLLERNGFVQIEFRRGPSNLLSLAEMSRRMAADLKPESSEPIPADAPPPPGPSDIIQEREIDYAEFLTVTARKHEA